MSPRDHLRQLVDELPDSEPSTAERVLSALVATADPVTRQLLLAPLDDEPETEEERARTAEAWAEHAGGEKITPRSRPRRAGRASRASARRGGS